MNWLQHFSQIQQEVDTHHIIDQVSQGIILPVDAVRQLKGLDVCGMIDSFVDSYGYLAHLWMRYPRLGFQRVTDIATRRVREGKITREEALDVIEQRDHILDDKALSNFLYVLGYSEDQFWDVVNNASWNKYKEK